MTSQASASPVFEPCHKRIRAICNGETVIDIQGLYCFYNEKVDLIIDGERQSRPTTKFS